MSHAIHFNPFVRSHRRRFRIDGERHHQKLATALKTLEESEEAILLALDRAGCDAPSRASLYMRVALRILVEGPAGELRGRAG